MKRVGSKANARSRCGLTLLELLMVMGIVGLVLGAGLGAFAGLDLDRDDSAARVRESLRAARAAASFENLPASVRVLPSSDALPGGGLEVMGASSVGSWQFERGERGPRGVEPELIGVKTVDDGYLGRAVDLRGAGREGAVAIPIQTDGRFDVRDGFALKVAVRTFDAQAGGRILDLCGVAGLELVSGNKLRGWVSPLETTPSGQEREGGSVEVTAELDVDALDRWIRVALVYDRVELALVVDGFTAAAVALEDPLPALDGSLVLGGVPGPVAGMVDAVTLAVYARSDALALPETFEWDADAPRLIRFGADGALDPLRHPGPLRFEFARGDAEPEVVRVSRYGTVE